jgi:pyrrolysine biosynthesis protein PylC
VLVGVVGGNLQGIEATYLAQKAGWEVIVVDRKPDAPASGLCERYIQLEVTNGNDLGPALKSVDLVIPALENQLALAYLNQWTRVKEIPFAFDPAAYGTTSSKVESNHLFTKLGLPVPAPWPTCGLPVIAKPSEGSGSHKISVFNETRSLQHHINESNEALVIQEFIQGPSYSLEVIGFSEQYIPLTVTDLRMDAGYDCKRVLAPTDLPKSLISDFEQVSISLAQALALKGLMDVEVILQENTLKILEVDARLPSQTPTTVFWSTGLNMVKLVGELFLNQPGQPQTGAPSPKGVVYEHIQVSPNLLEVAGEHIISGTDALRVEEDFFGADEAITNYAPGRDKWVATLIISGSDRTAAWIKRNAIISEIRQQLKLDGYRDSAPRQSSRREMT